MQSITFYRVMKLGWLNYWRNRGLSITATLILTLTLFIVLVFLLLNSVLSVASSEIRNKIDRLDVFFVDTVTDSEIQELQSILAVRSDTKQVTYISKEEALNRFHRYQSISETTRQAATEENNPLPRSLEIRAQTPEQLESISNFLSDPPWNDKIRTNTYQVNKEKIQKLSRFEQGVVTAGIGLSVTFVFLSVVVVLSTIRLAIFARREEVEIMRLVGANNIFIRVPFIVEAILYAVVGAILALVAAGGVVQQLGTLLNQFLQGIVPFDLPTLFAVKLPTLLLIELCLGLGIAILASLISLQRYLKR